MNFLSTVKSLCFISHMSVYIFNSIQKIKHYQNQQLNFYTRLTNYRFNSLHASYRMAQNFIVENVCKLRNYTLTKRKYYLQNFHPT